MTLFLLSLLACGTPLPVLGSDDSFSFDTTPWSPDVTDVARTESGALCVVGGSWFYGYGSTDVDQYVAGNARITRITADLDLDRAFGDGGTLEVPDTIGATAVAAAPDDGCLVAVGAAFDDVAYAAGASALVRVTASGQIDPAYPSPTLDHGDAPEHVFALAPAPDGGVFALGAAGTTVYVDRFTADGALDPDWGDAGEVVVPFAGVDCVATTLCSFGRLGLLADGSVLVAFGHPTVLAKLDPLGALDDAYGDGGIAASSGAFRVSGGAALADGSFALAGALYSDAAGYNAPIVERLDPSGAPALAPTSVQLPDDVTVADALVDDAGDVWLGGRFAEAPGVLRLLPDGAAPDGPLLDPPADPSYHAYDALVLAPGGVIAVGHREQRMIGRRFE